MPERREQVLGAVQRATDGTLGVREIADQVGIHPNTARFHLETLAADGLLDRVPEPPSGPGRPRVRYRARPGLARGDTRRYHLLAEILLSQLAATSDDPSAAAATAGRDWGAYLVPRPTPTLQASSDEDAGAGLTAMLEELDFAPELVRDDADRPDRVRLRHCPFLELARPHSDLVCPLHLGLMQGALTELRSPVTVTSLEPFAEDGACVAHLASAGQQRP